jgi:ribosome biogenesis GTPase
MIDRCLVAAFDAGLTPLLVLTKSDLAAAEPLLETYGALDLAYVVTNRDDFLTGGVDQIRERLADRVTAFVGHSGVGKTTLVNALVSRQRTTGHVNAVTGRGRHTTTSALALPLPGNTGWVIDTPGVRSFGLHHIDPSRVVQAFPDLEPGTEECPRGCSHDEPECALDAWVAAGHAEPARLDSLRRLLATRERREGD